MPAGLRSGESGGSGGEDDESDASAHGQRGGEQPAALARLEARELHLGTGAVLDGDAAQPRLDDAIGDEPAQQDDEDARRAGEAPVAERVHHASRIEELRRLLGETLEQWIDPRGDEVRREAAGHPGEGAGDAGERMASRGAEDDAAERDHQDVAGVGRGVAHHRDQQQHGSEQAARRDREHRAQSGADEADVLGDADAEHRHQHDARAARTR